MRSQLWRCLWPTKWWRKSCTWRQLRLSEHWVGHERSVLWKSGARYPWEMIQCLVWPETDVWCVRLQFYINPSQSVATWTQEPRPVSLWVSKQFIKARTTTLTNHLPTSLQEQEHSWFIENRPHEILNILLNFKYKRNFPISVFALIASLDAKLTPCWSY